MALLEEAIIYLAAAIVTVPISRRLGFGAVLGYLAAGIVIGPFGLALISDAEHILHFAEFGVVLLLFIIGLELKPSRLWVMRRMVFGVGTAQVVVSAALLALIAALYGFGATAAIVIGLILALSSTAFVLQLLAEKKQLPTPHGRAAFATLLFQDLAVIPMIAVFPMIGASAAIDDGFDPAGALLSAAALIALIVGGRYALKPVLKIAAASKIPEIFTATALLVVLGAAAAMQLAGMSMVLGAFIAGMLLADSEYRHQLEADIAPFKGLLLGLFFIAVGMSVNLALLFDIPGRILSIVAALMISKALVLAILARVFRLGDGATSLRFAAVMAQGGEFAFVLFGIASAEGLIPAAAVEQMILAVAVSMLLTPFAYLAAERTTDGMQKSKEADYDRPDDQHHEVIIAGFGRVGQIVARLLRTVDKPFTALEIDSSQVDVVRRYGNKVYYGDASRLDLLRAAGAEHAKILVLAIDDVDASVRTAEAVVRNFPHLTVIARVRNRRHAHGLMDLGIRHIFRETLLSSVAIGEDVLKKLGFPGDKVRQVSDTFRERDEKLLVEQYAVRDSEEKLIQSSKDTARELEQLLRGDSPG